MIYKEKGRKLMKKRLLVLPLILSAVLLSSCSQSTVKTDVVPSELAESLKNGVTFTDTLEEIDKQTLLINYDIAVEDIEDTAAYAGTGATAEEIAVFEAKDEQSAKEVYDAAVKRLAQRSEDYEAYRPEEVPKLDSAVVKQAGVFVAVCVSPESDIAEKIINNALFK